MFLSLSTHLVRLIERENPDNRVIIRVSSYPDSGIEPDEAIAAVIVLVGAFNVYFKMQNGDQDVKKTIMLTIGGCIAFIALSEALPLFFQ